MITNPRIIYISFINHAGIRNGQMRTHPGVATSSRRLLWHITTRWKYMVTCLPLANHYLQMDVDRQQLNRYNLQRWNASRDHFTFDSVKSSRFQYVHCLPVTFVHLCNAIRIGVNILAVHILRDFQYWKKNLIILYTGIFVEETCIFKWNFRRTSYYYCYHHSCYFYHHTLSAVHPSPWHLISHIEKQTISIEELMSVFPLLVTGETSSSSWVMVQIPA